MKVGARYCFFQLSMWLPNCVSILIEVGQFASAVAVYCNSSHYNAKIRSWKATFRASNPFLGAFMWHFTPTLVLIGQRVSIETKSVRLLEPWFLASFQAFLWTLSPKYRDFIGSVHSLPMLVSSNLHERTNLPDSVSYEPLLTETGWLVWVVRQLQSNPDH